MEIVDRLPGRDMRVRRIDWRTITAELRAIPADADGNRPWAKIGQFNPSIGGNMRGGKYRWVDPNEFEIITRKYDEKGNGADGLSWLYMRFRG